MTGENGIFNKVEQATKQYGQSKAREMLEQELSEAQMQKYSVGLTDEELDNKIDKVGELIPKEDQNSNIQQVIVDGFIFEIDRSVPKIKGYVGPADEIIITALVSGNNGWVKPSEGNESRTMNYNRNNKNI